ncbi:unnamed protein product [Fraxinus pennsylvanica]|uniref:AAA+ ATPase domain-containing protein n=1 Tax=Fraxinus pennsylvanica TaxID=56036 RepID=A0AAD1ZDX1_9LAMI|nr:unnamed protein product [Fraxinus pennsylvanica]
MVESVIGPCVEKLADYTIAAISRQFKYLFRYDRNIQNLRAKVQDLENKRDDVQSSVRGAKRNALAIKSEVVAWLKKVDDLKNEADEVLNSTNSEMRCLYQRRCPNLKTRYLLSRNAIKKTTAIVELQEEGKFDEVGVRTPLKLLSFHGSKALKTRISTKKVIIKALEDTDTSIVGICGLPGVGKTTMAKEVMTQVKDIGLFDEVAMVVVSKDAEIISVQDKLADMLGLTFDEKTNEYARASRLNERLTQDNKERILVILDDLWTDIDLKTLGIPPLSHREGLKILLTSRDKHVCEKMGALSNIEVEVLPREEAFVLFQDVAEIFNDATGLKDIAEQVAEECKGLPLAIEIVGKTLRNRERHEWRDVLNRLQHSQHSDRVYSSIQLSYNYLESDEHRSFLLLCSLFPEDQSIRIESLVRYARGLELFQYSETLLDTRNRAYTISDTLKSCHLLLSGDREEEVKLHDVIRDFCLWVASKGEHRYMVKRDLMTEWPEHDAHESYSAISLSFHKAIRLPSRLQYGNLTLLRLLETGSFASEMEIPKEFFDDMLELRVIYFYGVQIRSPIQLSMGLRTLCLNYCTLEIEISFFRSLKKLEILTFFRSTLSIDFHRNEMVELSNLRLLDLRFKKGPCPLPPDFLFGMKKLEELYLGYYNDTSYEEKEHIIKELRSLKALNTLQIITDDTQFLMQLLQACSEKLERFAVKRKKSGPKYRSVYLSGSFGDIWRDWMPPVTELDEDYFINLNWLELDYLDSEYLIDAAGSVPRGIFRNLELLELSNMSRLKEICNANFPRMEHLTRGVSQPALFYNLKDIRVSGCAKIKRMFSESVAKCMVNLQNLSLSFCMSLEEVVSMDTQENEITEPPSFPKLKRVVLYQLMRFVRFGSQPNAVGLRQILLNQVELPDMEKLTIRNLLSIEKILSMEETPFGSLNRLRVMDVGYCRKLVNIAQSNSIKLLKNLETLKVLGCSALNVIFDFEGLNVNKDDEKEICILGQLKSLELMRGDCLVHIMRMVPKGIRVFQNLKRLEVATCGRLKYLFSASMISSFVALETLFVHFCEEMEEIFGRDEEVVKEEGMASKIVFPELRRIELIDCDAAICSVHNPPSSSDCE